MKVCPAGGGRPVSESRRGSSHQQNRKAVARLEAIGEPRGGLFPTLEGTLVHMTWIRSLGMITHDPGHFKDLGKAIALNPELTPADILTLFTGPSAGACEGVLPL